MQLKKRNGGLQMLIAEHVVEWAGDARRADVIHECTYANRADKNQRADDDNDDLCSATSAASRPGGKRRRRWHLTRHKISGRWREGASLRVEGEEWSELGKPRHRR